MIHEAPIPWQYCSSDEVKTRFLQKRQASFYVAAVSEWKFALNYEKFCFIYLEAIELRDAISSLFIKKWCIVVIIKQQFNTNLLSQTGEAIIYT